MSDRIVSSVLVLPQKRVEDRKVQQPQPEATRDAGSDHFNSFQFWREPVAPLDSELLGLLVGAIDRCFFWTCSAASR